MLSLSWDTKILEYWKTKDDEIFQYAEEKLGRGKALTFLAWFSDTFKRDPASDIWYAKEWVDRVANRSAWDYADSRVREKLLEFKLVGFGGGTPSV